MGFRLPQSIFFATLVVLCLTNTPAAQVSTGQAPPPTVHRVSLGGLCTGGGWGHNWTAATGKDSFHFRFSDFHVSFPAAVPENARTAYCATIVNTSIPAGYGLYVSQYSTFGNISLEAGNSALINTSFSWSEATDRRVVRFNRQLSRLRVLLRKDDVLRVEGLDLQA
jgi:hypothetical protein